jgi:putative DNA methylase
MTQRKKLIEVALPLEAINAASAREKSIRHGHPSTLHLWWARRPLAACRAVLFGQLVDDPSSWPERFPTEEAQGAERKRLHDFIAELVKWESSNDERVLNRARWYIARSLAWGRSEEPPDEDDAAAVRQYLLDHAPPVYDPFCGGGSIPLEAQRLGLRAYGSDLNPVAVMISKALVEFPPKFAGLPPVNPEARKKLANAGAWNAKGAQGLAEDVRWYGRWMRDEAEKRIGHLYPKVRITPELAAGRPDLKNLTGEELTVIAWLWARTVASPNPACRGAHVPLVRSFELSTKPGRKVWVEPIVDAASNSYRFEIRSGGISKAPEGTVGRQGGRCLISGTPMPLNHIRAEGKAGRMGRRLMAIVAEGPRGRIYLPPAEEHERIAASAKPSWTPEGELPKNPRDFKTPGYGMKTWASLFTPRQLVVLTTFSDLVPEARAKALEHARAAGMDPDPTPLADDGTGAQAYADALAVYLAFAVDRVVDRHTTIATWDSSPSKLQLRNTFARQAIPMTWDYAEGNPFSMSSGTWTPSIEWVAKAVEFSPASTSGEVCISDAASNRWTKKIMISTDPPYYDNIGYADLSDFFYVWLRRALRDIFSAEFATVLVPKARELVATPYRFEGGREEAEAFFLSGMRRALQSMSEASADAIPMTLYYAFKQAEVETEGVVSTGWATFLEAVLGAGFQVDGTWPVRTELGNRMIGRGTNALAPPSSLSAASGRRMRPVSRGVSSCAPCGRSCPRRCTLCRRAPSRRSTWPRPRSGRAWPFFPGTRRCWRRTTRACRCARRCASSTPSLTSTSPGRRATTTAGPDSPSPGSSSTSSAPAGTARRDAGQGARRRGPGRRRGRHPGGEGWQGPAPQARGAAG